MKKHLFVYILILSAFSIQADDVNLACVSYPSSCVKCPEYQTLFPIEQVSSSSEFIEVEADQSEITENNDYLLSGNVKLISDDYVLFADEVEHSGSDQTTIAQGNIKYQDNDYLMTGENIFVTKENSEVAAVVNKAEYQQIESNANGSAEKITKNNNIVFFDEATYSYCPINQNDWKVKAHKLKINHDKNRGIADHATVIFMGYPIFYFPKYSWVLSGRGSGFLTPSFQSYREFSDNPEAGDTKERKVRIPYYFNIADDRDLVLAYTFMSSRGSIIEGKYRQLIDRKKAKGKYEDSMFELKYHYLFKDDITKLSRWLVDTSTELDINENIHFSARFNRVSDINYFKEIAHNNTDAERLNSHIKVSYTGPGWDLVELLAEDEQVVNDGSPEYTRAIEASISKTFNTEGSLPFQVGLISTQFNHDDPSKDSGTRIHGTLGISKELSSEFPIITSRANTSTTYYSLNIKDNITRTTVGAGLDLEFPFISQRQLFNTQVSRSITPKISYNYRGKVVQGNIPIFDTTDKEDETLTFAGLSSGERYTGLDRISNANDITLSFVSSYRELDAEEEDLDLFNYRIAQTYYADDEVVSNESNSNFEKRRSYSDIVAGIDLAVNQFAFKSNLQFDPEISKVTNRSNTISYKLNPKKFVSLTHTKDSSTSTVKLYGAYPVTDNIHLFGALDKNTSTGNTNKETTGVAYESCCWAMRLVHFKEKSGDGHDYITSFELVLKGLGSSADNIEKRIEENIPYYQANLGE